MSWVPWWVRRLRHDLRDINCVFWAGDMYRFGSCRRCVGERGYAARRAAESEGRR